jgi:hypothetical protein
MFKFELDPDGLDKKDYYYMVKNILIAFTFILLPFPSYGGSLDGKGMICGNIVGYWFENSAIHIHQISGHKISITDDKYNEVGTDIVEWGQTKAGNKNSVRYLTKLNRKTLTVGKLQCNLVRSKVEISKRLNQKICPSS